MRSVPFVILLSFVFVSLQAQTRSLSFGVGAGFNIADAKYDYFQPVISDSKIGFNGYLYVNLPLSNQFSLQSELGYYSLSSKINNHSMGLNFQDETLSANYINLTELAQFTLKHSGLSFQLGPSLGFKVHSDLTLTGTMNPYIQAEGVYVSGEMPSTNVFAVAGAQYLLPFGLGLSARYMYGLTNIAKESYKGSKIYSRALSFALVYRFATRSNK